MRRHNFESPLPPIDELEGYSGATCRYVAEPNGYSSKYNTVPDDPTHLVLDMSQREIAEVLPRKKYINSKALPFSEVNEVKLNLHKLRNKEETNISKFDTKVNNTLQTSLLPSGKSPVILKLPSREKLEQKVDNNKSFFSVIWDYICCCKKSSVSKTKIMTKKYDDFFNDLHQTSHDFKSSLLNKDTENHIDPLLGVTAESSDV